MRVLYRCSNHDVCDKTAVMTHPLTLVYIGHDAPPLIDAVEWKTHTELKGLVDQVVRAQPALVALAADNWPPYAHALKANSATRRVPLLLIGRVDADTARRHGVDAVVSLSDWQADPKRIVYQFARLPDPALREQLACQCAEPLPPRARAGVERFNQGEYYQQHDLFEAQWVEETGPVRDLYRAILQVGVAYYQITLGNYRGALKMLQKSVQWLAVLPDVCQGVDVRQLREDSARVREALERLGPHQLDKFDRALLRPVRLVQE
jgi:predicted metal-dependent hydrolase